MTLLDKLYCRLRGHNYTLHRAAQVAGRSGREWILTYECAHCHKRRRENIPDLVRALAKKFGIREEDL